MNGVGSTVFQAILLTILWFGFVFSGQVFLEGEPPKAIVVPVEFVELDAEEESKELPESVIQSIQSGQGGPVMTKEALEQATQEYERNHWLLGGLSVLSGFATFVVGLKLFEHWGYAVATLVLGPGMVAYYFRYVANSPSPPAPNLPPS
jgi:hypothetical protein